MTLASDIILAAYRESNLIAISATPSTAETTQALPRLNSILLSTIGTEAGGELKDRDCTFTGCVPENARLVLNLTAATTYLLDSSPYEGQRVAVADAGGNLATNNAILEGNGRTIEGAATITLAINGLSRQWLYRADTENWVRIDTLAASDAMPLPVEYDDYIIIMLAMRLNPKEGVALDPQSQMAMARTRSQIQARYRKPLRPNGPLLGLLHQRGCCARREFLG